MKVFVKAKTNAKTASVLQIDKQHFEVRVKESPVAGRANRAIEKALATYFNVPPSFVHVVKGVSSKNKLIEIEEKYGNVQTN